ncbi:hypothetical protein EJB05_44503 [Eragrostis curvula]|uniref:CASP-like protein n=1 Tax=Eragrostis curvula TaxID=38414 RepID=A0A5J9TID2_9POAL|nr:hypothetical protein EJB05_44503 [Eragrostis curvula]
MVARPGSFPFLANPSHILQKAEHYHFWQAHKREGFLLALLQPSPARKKQWDEGRGGEPGDVERPGAAAVAVPVRRSLQDDHVHRSRLLLLHRLHLIWSFSLACIDILSLMTKKDLHSPFHVWPLLVGDWFMGVNSFAAFSAATGAIIYFERDAHFCRAHPDLACDQYELSIALVFMAWSFVAASATSLFWLLVSFY